MDGTTREKKLILKNERRVFWFLPRAEIGLGIFNKSIEMSSEDGTSNLNAKHK